MPQPDDDAPIPVDGEFNAADPKAINRRKQRSKQRQGEEDKFIRGLLSSAEGRTWYWKQLVACHIFEASWRGDGTDSMVFREGERNIGNRLLAQLMRASPDSFILMMQENKTDG